MEHVPLEAVDALDIGQPGVGQPAGSGDEELGGERAGAGLDSPQLLALVPVRGRHLMVVADVGVDVVLV